MSMYGKFPKEWDGFRWKDAPTVDCSGDKPITVQSNRNEVDINSIVARVAKGGTVTTSSGEPWFGDVSDFTGLQDAIIKVQEADDLFMQLDASVRERFDNDPVQLVDFLSDDRNRDEAIRLGLVRVRQGDVSSNPVPPAPVVPEPPSR